LKIKEFEALTLKDCLSQVRQDLGPEAVILETRKLRKGGILGWGGRDAVRIIAGTGIAVEDGDRRQAARRTAASRSTGTTSTLPTRIGEDVINPTGLSSSLAPRSTPDIAAFLTRHAASAEMQNPTAKENTETQDKLTRLEAEMRDMKAALTTMGNVQAVVGGAPQSADSFGHSPARFPELMQRLLDADVREELAAEMVGEIPNLDRWSAEVRSAMAEQAIRDVMQRRIRTAPPPDPAGTGQNVIALIGPTGVGKTTTIAKLAAQHALVQKKPVGLITMDTYRIAAVDQLKSYARIIGIPIEVVHNQAEIGPALARLAGCSLILIDTAGRSQKNVMQVSELKSLVDAAKCETHLVLAASTRERDLLDQVERFSGAGVDRLIFTKLDETITCGTLFNMATTTGIPLSYLADGQKVPEDIEVATADGLIDRVLASSNA